MRGRRAMEGVNRRGERGGEGEVGDIKPVCTEDCVRITEIKCQPKERAEWSGVERSRASRISLYLRRPAGVSFSFSRAQRSGVRETRERAIHRGPGLTLRAWQT